MNETVSNKSVVNHGRARFVQDNLPVGTPALGSDVSDNEILDNEGIVAVEGVNASALARSAVSPNYIVRYDGGCKEPFQRDTSSSAGGGLVVLNDVGRDLRTVCSV